MPIIGFNIYNPDKKVITEFTKNELQFYGNAMFLIKSIISKVFLVIIAITQIDVALVSVLFSEFISLFTIRMLLDEKTFEKDQESTEPLV